MGSVNTTNPVAVPEGSLVLITGASGYIAGHVVMQFLERGYKVRGTIRNPAKAAFLSEGVFASYAKRGSIELVEVPDMSAPGAYKEAIRGVDIVVNIASDLSLSTDADKVISSVVASVIDLLKLAAAESSVKRFVHCSTMGTVYEVSDRTDISGALTQESWNEAAVEKAYNLPRDDPVVPLNVYAASKVKAEQAAWKFVKEEKPQFVLNTIHPYCVFGAPFSKAHLTSSAGWIVALYNKLEAGLPLSLLMGYIAVEDTALLHIAAALDPELKNQRILGTASKFNWNDILHILRKNYPDRTFQDDVPGVEGVFGQTIDNTLPVSILKKWAGRSWIPMEDSIKSTIKFSES